VLSARIVKFRDALGGFQNANQLLDVYGLEPVIARRVSSVFPILNAPEVNVVNLNTASAAELSNVVYFSEKEVEIILAYRFSNGGIRSLKALGEALGWNLDKIDRIAVYLAL
jgi:DNA uptake protein ComE-like DNA-binding protein